MKNYKYKAGFTLIEMLVVIAIVGILMGMFIPSLGKAKKHARKVECMSNLKQLYMASVRYATDGSGSFPGECNVYTFLPYQSFQAFQ